MLAIGLLLALLGVVGAQQCFNGGVYGGSKINKCYHFVYSPQTYEEAEAVCGGLDGLLVSIPNAFEQSFVFGHARLRFVLRDYWIGLTDLTEDGVWKWSDETKSNYTNWISNTPSSDADDNCVAVRLNSGHWYSTKCDTDKKYFVCQVDPVTLEPAVNASFCPLSSEFEASRGRCLHFIPSFQSYPEAELTCGSIQGALVSMSDANDAAFVTGRARVSLPRQDYWIGLNSLFTEKEWQWVDDTSPSYLNWASGFPSKDANKSCVAARATKGNWYNSECETTGKYFVCESLPTRLPTPTASPPPTTPPPTCPACPTSGVCPTCAPHPFCPTTDGDWVYFSQTGAWYKLLPRSSYYQWDTNEALCVGMGAHLASIHSSAENWFVYGLGAPMNIDVAIGMKSTSSNLFGFRWTDNTVTDFTNWASAPTGSAYCVRSRYGAWYNTECNGGVSMIGVCKKTTL